MNGDILARVDFRSMLAFHRREHAAFTVAVRRYEVEVPYGTVRSDGPEVREIIEKPHFEFLVNAGIYLLEPEILELIPSGQPLEMTELIGLAIELGHRVVNLPDRRVLARHRPARRLRTGPAGRKERDAVSSERVWRTRPYDRGGPASPAAALGCPDLIEVR